MTQSLKTINKDYIPHDIAENYYYETFSQCGIDMKKSISNRGFSELEKQNQDKIKKVIGLLSDKKSVEAINSVVNYKKSGGKIKYYPDWSDIQYFPKDIDLFKNIDAIKFIDCGGYDGDTAMSLLENHEKVDTIVSFEPDIKNYKKMTENFKIFKKHYKNTNFYAIPTGVWHENDILKFNALGQGDSRVSNIDNKDLIQIPVAPLDEVLFAMEPNYIKMDIEGSEKEAILGCKDIIKLHKPTLAICLYHKHEDLWEIPLLIHEMNPSYKMYIRVHMYFANETVLYCVNE